MSSATAYCTVIANWQQAPNWNRSSEKWRTRCWKHLLFWPCFNRSLLRHRLLQLRFWTPYITGLLHWTLFSNDVLYGKGMVSFFCYYLYVDRFRVVLKKRLRRLFCKKQNVVGIAMVSMAPHAGERTRSRMVNGRRTWVFNIEI